MQSKKKGETVEKKGRRREPIQEKESTRSSVFCIRKEKKKQKTENKDKDKNKNKNKKLFLILPRVDPTVEENCAIRKAAEYGDTDLVRILLKDPRVDPSAQNNYAIRMTSTFQVVKILLSDPRVDPTTQDNAPIRWAALIGAGNNRKETKTTKRQKGNFL